MNIKEEFNRSVVDLRQQPTWAKLPLPIVVVLFWLLVFGILSATAIWLVMVGVKLGIWALITIFVFVWIIRRVGKQLRIVQINNAVLHQSMHGTMAMLSNAIIQTSRRVDVIHNALTRPAKIEGTLH